MKRMKRLKYLTWTALGGSFLMQTPGCVDTAVFVTTASQVVTAGGVLYLVSRVLE